MLLANQTLNVNTFVKVLISKFKDALHEFVAEGKHVKGQVKLGKPYTLLHHDKKNKGKDSQSLWDQESFGTLGF